MPCLSIQGLLEAVGGNEIRNEVLANLWIWLPLLLKISRQSKACLRQSKNIKLI
jgi:hypothetical protein